MSLSGLFTGPAETANQFLSDERAFLERLEQMNVSQRAQLLGQVSVTCGTADLKQYTIIFLLHFLRSTPTKVSFSICVFLINCHIMSSVM